MEKRCENCKHYTWRYSYCYMHDFEVDYFDRCKEFEKINFFESEGFEIIFLLTLVVLATLVILGGESMEKKYIIEIPDDKISDFLVENNTHLFIPYSIVGYKRKCDTGLSITPYTEPDLEQIKADWYKAGREAEKVRQPDLEQVRKEAYQKGLNDLWEAMQKAIKMYCEIDNEVFLRVFHDVKCDWGESVLQALFKNTPQHLIDSIRQYEQRQEEQIQVGDEVIAASGKAVIIDISDNKDNARYIYSDSTLGFDNICNLRKTGRRFSEVAALFEKMREDGTQNRIQETMSDDY